MQLTKKQLARMRHLEQKRSARISRDEKLIRERLAKHSQELILPGEVRNEYVFKTLVLSLPNKHLEHIMHRKPYPAMLKDFAAEELLARTILGKQRDPNPTETKS